MDPSAAIAWLAEGGRGPGTMPATAGLADLARSVQALAAILPQPASSCRRGCNACCHQVAPMSPAEAFLLASQVGRRAHLAARSTAWRRRYRRLSADPAGRDIARRLRCPALGDDGACTIHRHRPLACREHLVDSDPARCHGPDEAGVRILPLPLRLAEALLTACAGLMRTAPTTIAVGSAVAWARANRGWDARRWPRHELLAALAAALAGQADRQPAGDGQREADPGRG